MPSISETSRVCEALIEKHVPALLGEGKTGGTLKSVGLSKAAVQRLTKDCRPLVERPEGKPLTKSDPLKLVPVGCCVYTGGRVGLEKLERFTRLLCYRLNSTCVWSQADFRMICRLLGFEYEPARRFFLSMFAGLNPDAERVAALMQYTVDLRKGGAA